LARNTVRQLRSNRYQTIKRQLLVALQSLQKDDQPDACSEAPADTAIDLPPDVASAVEAFFNDEEGTCSATTNPSLRSRDAGSSDLAQYVLCLARDSIEALAPDGPLSRIWDLVSSVDKSTILPVFKEPAYQKSMVEAVAYGGVYLPTIRQGSSALICSIAAWSMYRLAPSRWSSIRTASYIPLSYLGYLFPGQQIKDCPVDNIECSNSLCTGHDGHCSSVSLFAHCEC
jgi:hypothetical protein